jgi:hypothetical protein
MEMSKNLLAELQKFNSRPIPVRFDIESTFGNLTSVKIVYQSTKKTGLN